MKASSVQFKFLLTVISAILAIAVFVGGFSVYEMDSYIQQHTKELIEVSCSNEAAQINATFDNIENSVKIMESYVLSLFRRVDDIEDRDNQEIILQLSGEMFVNIAANTDGAVAYYLRFDPKISDGKTGIFYSKMNGSDEYTCLEPTDISLYEKTDTENVGWFWIPYEAGCPIWLDPYYNPHNDILMISFVVPLYFENQFVGVVGIDFDYTVLTERVHQIKIFEHGFAHLELDGDIIHTGREHSDDEHVNIIPEKYFQSTADLLNGMTLALFADNADIREMRYAMAAKIVLAVILLALIFSFIVVFVVKKTIKPLKTLTEASIKLSSGDYDIEIEHSNTYEIRQLIIAFETMLVNLREHKKLQHILTYRDSLTGLRNTTSYKEWVVDFDKKIKEEDVSFGVVVFDINYLKEANDTYGHNIGNKLIVSASQIIASTFKRSPVFRIGGDEFVAILQGSDLEDRKKLFLQFETACENAILEEEGLFISVAKGFAMFDSAKDTQFSDVFNRADDRMYQHKKKIKTSLL